MPIQRTAWQDDDGSGTTGTIINNAEKTLLYNQIDAALIDPASNAPYKVVSSTATGTVNNWNPGLAGHTFIEWSGAASLTITGLAGGVAGQHVIITNVTIGAYVIFCAHYNAGSTQKLVNVAGSGPTPIAAGGSAHYLFDGSNWVLIAHEQGAWITPPFSAANFGASDGTTWTVDAGDVAAMKYRLSGKTLSVIVSISATSLSNIASQLFVYSAGYGGYSWASGVAIPLGTFVNNGTTWETGARAYVTAGDTIIRFQRFQGGPFSAVTNGLLLDMLFMNEVN